MLWNWNTTFEDMDALRREVNSIFDRTNHYIGRNASFPAINIYNQEHDVLIVALLPGLKKENLEVSYLEGAIRLKGDYPTPEETEDKVLLRSERQSGSFDKSVRIPFDIDADNITAHLQDGVLRLVLPKAAQAKSRQISIQ